MRCSSPHIGGTTAAHGVLRTGRRWLTGTLDGHRVRVRAIENPIASITARGAGRS